MTKLLSKKDVKACFAMVRKQFDKNYNHKPHEIFTFRVDMDSMVLDVKIRIDPSDFSSFYGAVSEFFNSELEMDTIVQIYEKGDHKMKKKLNLYKCKEDEIFGCEFIDMWTLRELFDRCFMVDRVEKLKGTNVYKITWWT